MTILRNVRLKLKICEGEGRSFYDSDSLRIYVRYGITIMPLTSIVYAITALTAPQIIKS